jgi:uncharacterized membrane protein
MRLAFLYIMAGFYMLAGINHFVHPGFYEKIMPSYLPCHEALIRISGACEISFGLLLLPASTRRVASFFIIALLIAIFPANIEMAMNFWREQNHKLWIAIARLPLQLVFIWWAYLYTKKEADEV